MDWGPNSFRLPADVIATNQSRLCRDLNLCTARWLQARLEASDLDQLIVTYCPRLAHCQKAPDTESARLIESNQGNALYTAYCADGRNG